MTETIERVRIDTLNLHPSNARRGNVDVIAESLFANGQIVPIVVQRSTRNVIGGNHTLKAARSIGRDEIDVIWRDVDDVQAKRELLALNRTSDLAEYDTDMLIALLKSFDDLTGTGYDEDALRALLNEETPLVEGDADVDDSPVSFAIVVDCDTEAQQLRLLERFMEEGLNVRAI